MTNSPPHNFLIILSPPSLLILTICFIFIIISPIDLQARLCDDDDMIINYHHRHQQYHITLPPLSSSSIPTAVVSPVPSSAILNYNAAGSGPTHHEYYNAPALTPTSCPSPSISPPSVFNVRAFGAIGNGITDDSAAFMSAFNSACEYEPELSTVVIPPGFSFLIGPTVFTGPCKNRVGFQVEGRVIPPDGPDSWPRNRSKRIWLVFYKINGLSIQGGGIFDGKGEKWWNLPCKPHRGINGTTLPGPCDSPVAMRFMESTDLRLSGIQILNSPEFHIRFDNCRTVHVDSLTITSPPHSPNTDGIHVENTRDVTIHNSIIANGDDCISIGAGSENIDIRNITCGPGSHGISIGSLGVNNSHACVSNITVTNSKIKHSDNGLRIKTWQGSSGSVSSITFNNITMDTVRNPIIIDQYYCSNTSNNCTNQTSNVFISGVSYTNIRGTYDTRSGPVRLACSDQVPCTELKMNEVKLAPAGVVVVVEDEDDEGMKKKIEAFCWNAYGNMGDDVQIVPKMDFCLLEGTPMVTPPRRGMRC